MTVILMTKCGCTKTMEVPIAHTEIAIPIFDHSPLQPLCDRSPYEIVHVQHRVFRQLHGNNPVPVYLEI